MVERHVPTASGNERATILACNRSGSTLLLTLLKALLPGRKVDRDTSGHNKLHPAESSDRDGSRLAFEGISSWLEQHHASTGLTFHKTGATGLGTIDSIAGGTGKFIFVVGIPCPRFLVDRVHLSYTRPQPTFLPVVRSTAPAFVTLRHPYDILVSHAFEMEHVFESFFPHGPFHEVESGFREAWGRHRLASPQWVRGAASYVKRFYEATLEEWHTLVAVRYEDLLDQPRATIRKIAGRVGRQIDDEEADALWSRVGLRPLKAHRTHYFRPSAGKWQKYLSSANRGLLHEVGLDSIARELGYDVEGAAPQAPPPRVKDGATRLKALQIADAMNQLMFGTPVVFRDDQYRWAEGAHGLRLVTNCEELEASMLASWSSRRFQDQLVFPPWDLEGVR